MVGLSRSFGLGTAVVTLSLVALAGCAAATPTCDEASGLRAASRLADAAATYALARERSEGDCAQSGLTAVGNGYGDAYVDVTKGRVAEDAGNVDGAVSAYRAALAIDAENPAAKDALARLQQPEPTLQPLPQRPPLTASSAVVPPLLMWLAGGAVALLLAVAGLLTWMVSRWTQWRAEHQREQAQLRDRVTKVDHRAARVERGLGGPLTAFAKQAADGVPTIEARLGTQGAAIEALRLLLKDAPVKLGGATSQRLDALEQHLDDVVEAFTEMMAAGGQPAVQRFVPQASDDGHDVDERR
jgi:hypothetical protein